MASGIGQTLLHEILGLFRGVPVTAQSSYALDLLADAPAADGTGTLLTSGTAPGYSFVEIDSTPANWNFENARTMSNKNLIFLPAATTGSWPSVQGAALRRISGGSPTGTGDFFGHIQSGRIIDMGERLKILPGELKIYIPATNYFVSDAFTQLILGLLQGTNINAPSKIKIKMGRKDPSKNLGDIGVLTGSGYSDVEIDCNTTNFAVPANRKVKNAIEWDHTKLWTTEADVNDIISAAIATTDGTEWIRGLFTKSKSLKKGDNLRIPASSFEVFG